MICDAKELHRRVWVNFAELFSRLIIGAQVQESIMQGTGLLGRVIGGAGLFCCVRNTSLRG